MAIKILTSVPIKITERPTPVQVVGPAGPVNVQAPTVLPGIKLAGSAGARGPAGPDPWLDQIQTLSGSGPFNLNYELGKHVVLTLTGNATISIINWPPANTIARLTLEVINTGNFLITGWPAGTIWQSGSIPAITQGAGARDRIIFSTTDAGAVIYGDPIGFDYR
jgi:hypothetical protein